MTRASAPTDSQFLVDNGYELFAQIVPPALVVAARETLFDRDGPGTRALLDEPAARDIARHARERLVAAGRLPASAVAIQAIVFDKTATTNWKVTWHQDLMFPFAQAVSAAGYERPSRKAAVDYARPPREVLEALLAVRVHLDRCDESNGPLRVSPGTHRFGILRGAEFAAHIAEHGERVCLAAEGDALLLKPLVLHASSPATSPTHRRVLHLVYHSGTPIAERWHRAV